MTTVLSKSPEGQKMKRLVSLSENDESSVLLDVGGEITVPNVESKEELAEMLASGKYVLDLSKAELRMSDDMKEEVFEALGLNNMNMDVLKSKILLSGVVTQAPPGTHNLMRNFMRKGSRNHHFAVVCELAKRRREELEKAAQKPMPPPVRKRSSGLLRSGSTKEISSSPKVQKEDAKQTATEVQKEDAKQTATETVVVAKAQEATPVTAEKKNKLSPQQYDELCTFRSATTASELGTSRVVHDV